MNYPESIRTERLLLRRWRPEDREPFAKLNADPRVLEFLPGALTREESDARIDEFERHFDQHGFGRWAVEVPDVAPFIGFVGLSIPQFEAHFLPGVEVSWRIDAEHWNRGYASEAALASVQFGFTSLQLGEVVSFTVPDNLASRRVMEKIGMTRDVEGDFDHPILPEGHRLRRHVLYRLASTEQ